MSTSARSTLSPLWHRVADAKPRLQPHVEVVRHVVRDVVWYVAYDNISNKSFRFSPSVYSLVMRLNGRRTVDSIWQDLAERMDEDAPSQDDVLRLLGQLYLSDMLLSAEMVDADELTQRSTKQERKKVVQRFQNPLFLRIPLLDPDNFLNKTMPLVRPFFSVFGAILWLICMVWLGVQAAVNWDELTSDIVGRVLAVDNLLLIVLVFPALKAVHELGHAYATKLYGGEVHDVGLMFLIFIPVPYVDASASSVFSNKWQRILVASAGMFAEFFVAAAAMFIWLNAEPGMVRALAFNAMLIATVSTVIFNGNPLLRFDAYYILADLVEVPNLAARANKYWIYLAQSKCFGMANATNPIKAPGERGWLLFYGPAALVYRIIVMVGIAIFVSTTFFIIGVLLAAWSITTSLLWPTLKGIAFVFSSDSLTGRRPRALLATAVGIAAVFALFFVLPVPHGTVATGVVAVPENARIVSSGQGDVTRLLVAHGDELQAGQAMLELSDPSLLARLDITKARLLEVELRRRVAEAEAVGEVALYQQQAGYLLNEKSDIEQKIAELVIKSPVTGTFISPSIKDTMGRYAPRGELLGHMFDKTPDLLQVVVPQDEVDLVRSNTKSVSVKFASSPIGAALNGSVLREVPGATRMLPSPSLAQAAGGPIAVNSTGGGEVEALFPLFLFEIALDDELSNLRLGERVFVRFDHGASPLGPRIYRAVRQTFLRQFGV